MIEFIKIMLNQDSFTLSPICLLLGFLMLN